MTNKDTNRTLAILGGVGLALAMLGRKRRWRRFAMGQMMGPGFGGYGYGPWGRGGYGPWGRFGHGPYPGAEQEWPLPPFIEARLKAWHDRAHGNVPPSTPSAETGPSETAKV